MKNTKSAFTAHRAISSFSVDDLAKAQQFYGTTLGIPVNEDKKTQTLTLHLGGSGRIFIYPKGPAHVPATFTVLNFRIDDVEAAVDELRSRGIQFERYDGFNQDEKGIARGNTPGMAWFKDPAGNILSELQDR